MPSLKEIKTRITSVQGTRKITSAMKMVASSKLHHAQSAIENMLPYEEMLEKMLSTFLVSDAKVGSVYAVERPVSKVALVVFSSSSSLCGGFNANVIKEMHHTIGQYMATGLSKSDIVVYAVGRKVYENAVKNGLTCFNLFPELAEKPNAEDARRLAQEVSEKWLSGEFDKVDLIYHHFKSAGSQILTTKHYLPIDLKSELGKDAVNGERQVEVLPGDYIVEPDKQTVMQALVPSYLRQMVYTALLDSNASEHAARMVAMQTATDNADELLSTLNLQYNKSRQAAITNELLDIMGGSVNN